jgi:hypothetical protein
MGPYRKLPNAFVSEWVEVKISLISIIVISLPMIVNVNVIAVSIRFKVVFFFWSSLSNLMSSINGLFDFGAMSFVDGLSLLSCASKY